MPALQIEPVESPGEEKRREEKRREEKKRKEKQRAESVTRWPSSEFVWQTEEAMASLERCAESVGDVHLEIARSLDAYQGSGIAKVEFSSGTPGSRTSHGNRKGCVVRE